MGKNARIYRFEVTLLGVEPVPWRLIEVPETYTFWDVHVAIQDAMGWLDDHLHAFVRGAPQPVSLELRPPGGPRGPRRASLNTPLPRSACGSSTPAA